MYIPLGSAPSSLDQLVGDLERRQARGGAASVKSASTNNSAANSVQSNNTNSTRGPARAQPAPAPRVPVGRQPRSIDDIVSDLETRQVRGGAASVASASTNGGARSVQSVNTNSTRGQGRAPARNPPARIPVGSQPRSIDELLFDLETRQVRGDAASVASASTNGGARSVQSVNTNSTRGQGRAPVRNPPARIPVGSQPRSIDELVSDLERRQRGGGAASVASASTDGQSVQSNNTNSTAAQPRRGPARNATAPVPVGSRPRSIDELLSDLERRQVRGGGAASVVSASSNNSGSIQSAASNNTNSTRGARQPAPPARIPIGAQPALPARIPIGAQPRSLAELVGDLERRQATGRDNASVSSVSTKGKANKAPSVKSTKEPSSATPAPVTSSPAPPPGVTAPAPTTSSPALPPPPPPAAPTSAPATTTAPAAINTPAPAPPVVVPPVSSGNPAVPPASNGNPVQNPVRSSTAAPVVASPSPTTLLTRVASLPGGGATPMPDLQLSSSTDTAGSIATILPPAGEIPSGSSPSPPPPDSANSEIGPPGGASMSNNTMVGVLFGCILGAGILVAFLMVCCVRRRLAKAKRDSDLAMASQYPNEKGPRPLTEWEDRLYGSNRSTGGGFSEKAKSIFVVPWRLLSGIRGGQEPPPPPPVLPQLPLPPKLGGDDRLRYSKRSTGLTSLDETQFKTYNNLVGRSNPKKPVAFDNPYFQRDDWK